MNLWHDITFANHELLWLLVIIPIAIAWYVWRHKKQHAELLLTTVKGIAPATTNVKLYARHGLFGLRMLALAALITALARPQSSSSWQDVTTQGIDIVIAVDISSSMLARDLKPNRLEASKKVAIKFIEGRPNDRMGLVVYSGESFTQCPLTTDHAVLKNIFKDVKNGMIEDGTAIGLGLANAVNRLKDSDAISKVIILLTDGSNNSGSIPPLTAAEIAKAFGIRVYTIGVGTNGKAPYPVNTAFGTVYKNMEVKIDEETLKQIAEMTDAGYYRATNNKKLEDIYKEIDLLEKSKIEVTEYKKRNEEFLPYALAAALLLLIEMLMKHTFLRSIV